MYTHSTGTPQLDFDGDIYPLHLFFSAQTAQHFALERVNRHVLRAIVKPEQGELIVEALLAPIESATKIGVWVQDEFLGVIAESQFLLNSQLSRIFASGHLISSQLLLTPSKGSLASVLLPNLKFGLISNDPPRADSHLLPLGRMWRVEPTVNALFEDFSLGSTILFGLRLDLETLIVSYNGIECGILNFDDASALSSAVKFSNANGLTPTVLGHVVRENGETSFEIDVLPLELWSKKQHRLEVLKIPRLIPKEADSQNYVKATALLSDEILRPQTLSKKALSLSDTAVKYSPHVACGVGLFSLFAVIPFHKLSDHSAMLLAVISLMLFVLAVVILFKRIQSTNTQHWNLASSVGLLATLPIIIFLVADTLIPQGSLENHAQPDVQVTTLASRPPNSPTSLGSLYSPSSSMVQNTEMFALPPIASGQSPVSTFRPWLDRSILPLTRENSASESAVTALGPSIVQPASESIATPAQTSQSRHAIDDGDDSKTSTGRPAPTTNSPIIALPPTWIIGPEDPESTDSTAPTEPSEPVATDEPSETSEQTSPLLAPSTTPETEPETTEAPVETTEASSEITVSEVN
ncbi:hypothetical protein [Corynebacterium glutamicum]|uniref:hypothetical protein n=1 Tax=Corynebacterium glutamicum TaxID=1718 RepID=UPI000744AD6E|nr:hypothetical protein [Corynebacterium glutamicum]ALZ99802.1 hypothetical protein APT58_05910 [Corynebacterium glutamicum]